MQLSSKLDVPPVRSSTATTTTTTTTTTHQSTTPRLFGGASLFSCHHVDDGVLDERRKDEDEADDHPDVDGLDVGDAWQRGSSTAAHRRRRQDRQQADGYASRRGVDVDPEGYPRQDDDEDARHVDLDEEIADVAPEDELELETRIGTCETGGKRSFVNSR